MEKIFKVSNFTEAQKRDLKLLLEILTKMIDIFDTGDQIFLHPKDKRTHNKSLLWMYKKVKCTYESFFEENIKNKEDYEVIKKYFDTFFKKKKKRLRVGSHIKERKEKK